MRLPSVVCFVAPSGTGKTTLLCGVIDQLARRGVRVGVLKHDAHRLELDKKGKDTWRFRQAGAWRAVIAGEEQLAVFSQSRATSMQGLVDGFLADSDLVVAEGFRRSGLPMIRVHRKAVHDPTWQAPADPIAWVSDDPERADLPLDRPDLVADWLVERFVAHGGARRASLVLPVRDERDLGVLLPARDRLGALFDDVFVVHAPDVDVQGIRAVRDIRPDIGPLGGLLTGLAAADTPDVIYLGARHANVPEDTVAALLSAPRRFDASVPTRGSLSEPLCALYGHRCLSAIQAAILSGEYRMDSWWGSVRVNRQDSLVFGPAGHFGASDG